MKAFIAALLLSIFLLPGIVSAEETKEKKEEYIVTFKEKSEKNFKPTKKDVSSITSEGGTVKEVMALGFAVAELTEKQAEKVKNKKNVLYVNRNKSLKTENINMRTNGRAITLTHPEQTWRFFSDDAYNEEIPYTNKMGFTGKGVNIAVIDTGIGTGDELPEDIPEKNIKGRINCYKDEGTLKEAASGDCDENTTEIQGPHGTAVVDVIVGKHNDIAFDGIAPDAGIYSISYKKPEDTPQRDISQWDDHLRALNWVFNHNLNSSPEDAIDIINMSFEMILNGAEPPEEHQIAINRLYLMGVLLVAGSGNGRIEGEPDEVAYPAAYANVIAVGAVDREGNNTDFSQRGEKLDLVAPGQNLLLAVPNKYDTKEAFVIENIEPNGEKPFWIPLIYKEHDELQDDMNGTSFASPMVAGAAALLLEQYPQATAADLKWMLYYNASVPEGDEKQYVWGDGSQLKRTNEHGFGLLQARPYELRRETRGYRKDGVGSEDNILYSITSDQIVYNYPSEKSPKEEYGKNGWTTISYYWGFFKSDREDSKNAAWAQLKTGEWVKRNDLKVGVPFYLFNDAYIERAYPRATMPEGVVTVTRKNDYGDYKTDYEYDGDYAWITSDSGSLTPFKNTDKFFLTVDDTKAYYQPHKYPEEVDVKLPEAVEPEKCWTDSEGETWYRMVIEGRTVWLKGSEMLGPAAD